MPTDEQRAAKAAYDRAYRARNKERKSAIDKAYAELNRDKIREYQAAYREKNREKHLVYHREYHANNRDRHKANGRRAYLKYKYGLSDVEYARMVEEQGGVCRICGKQNTANRHLAIDHDHRTGAVRALLCSSCNSAIGLLGDDATLVERAAEYLRSYQTSEEG